MTLEVYLPVIFWKSLSRIGVSPSLNFWSNSAVKLSGPGLLCAGRFLITVSISVLVMGLLRFLFPPGSVLESYTFLRICPFIYVIYICVCHI